MNLRFQKLDLLLTSNKKVDADCEIVSLVQVYNSMVSTDLLSSQEFEIAAAQQ